MDFQPGAIVETSVYRVVGGPLDGGRQTLPRKCLTLEVAYDDARGMRQIAQYERHFDELRFVGVRLVETNGFVGRAAVEAAAEGPATTPAGAGAPPHATTARGGRRAGR